MIYPKLILFLSVTFFAMEINAQDLKQHRWENRILIVKATDEDSANVKQQLKLFTDNKNGLIERKLVLYKIVNDEYHFIDYAHSHSNKSGAISGDFKSTYLPDQEDFKVILLGLDGGIKLQKSSVLNIDKLFSTIDAMPMRQNEMKKN